jgi:hypothetical protein
MVIHTNDLTEHLVMRIHDDATNQVDPIERIVAGGRKYRSRKGDDTAPNFVRLSSILEADRARHDAIRMHSSTLNPKQLRCHGQLRTGPDNAGRSPGHN